MKGQIRFDEWMNMSEEKPQEYIYRTPMVDSCHYCLCRTCINNAESITTTPDDVPYDWKPCFYCEECSNFDREEDKDMERGECSRYQINSYYAEKNREKFKIVRKK